MRFKLEFTFDISDSSLLIDANDGRDEEYTSLEDEPESFIGGGIALSTVVKVMESLGWKFCTYDGFNTNGWDIDYWLYFIKDEKDFSYRVSGNVYFGGIKIEKCEKHYER